MVDFEVHLEEWKKIYARFASSIRGSNTSFRSYYGPACVNTYDTERKVAPIPRELLGWNHWEYSGKGPRWPCWKCRSYFRELFSDLEKTPSAPDYGISVGDKHSGNTTWTTFEYKWYCIDCLKKLGVIW